MLIRSFVPHYLARLTELTIETFRPLVGQVVFANMHYGHLFGRPASEMLGRGWEAMVLPEDLERHCAAFMKAFNARASFHAETRVRDKAGQVRSQPTARVHTTPTTRRAATGMAHLSWPS